jgi:GTPase SAR1 family protein
MGPCTRRPALGQKVAVGTLYDARKDHFLADNMLAPGFPNEAFHFLEQNEMEIKSSVGDSYRSRFEVLGLPMPLAGSILTGPVTSAGASRYLEEPRECRGMHGALHQTFNTCQQTLNMQFNGLRRYLTSSTITNPDATHMVAGIEWGARNVISVRVHTDFNTEKTSRDEEFQTLMAAFTSAAEGLTGIAPGASSKMPHPDPAWNIEIIAYSEMFEESDGIMLADLTEAYNFLQMTPLHVKGDNGGRGWPVTYGLLPVDILGLLLGTPTPNLRQSSHPDPNLIHSGLCLIDDFLVCERKLDDYQTTLLANAQYIPPEAQNAISDRLSRLCIAKQRFKDDFVNTLSSVKSGQLDPGALRQTLDHYTHGDLSPAQIGDISVSHSEVLAFVQDAVSKGTFYVGFNGIRLENVLQQNQPGDVYVFYFSSRAMKEDSWKPNLELFTDLQHQHRASTAFVVVDLEALDSAADIARIAQFQDGIEAVPDLLSYCTYMADKCFAECDESTMETEDIRPPIQRRHVTIPCPGTTCSVAKVHEWLCPRCHAPVEYGYTDRYIYCNCGRSFYTHYVFRCSNETHGPNYTPYEPERLLRLLNGLVQSNYLNILIFGETGVGKSTFINALVNYLEFETLDEAIEVEQLNYVVPCSFATQIMDRTNPYRPIEEKRIKIGAREDEHDGSKGDSATQKTTVYPVTFHYGESTLTVRLIDTPGIGDSRGVDADRQNMADILAFLSGYVTVHGILILLKSNNARLTPTFRYWIQELFTHLHYKAAENMAFGFTHTRISNYTPGDTYGPLKALLDRHSDVELQLATPTTYGFDSESFRYLAALKSGVTMPNKVDFDRSWNESRGETIRLIERFQSIPPHEVKNTESLNSARRLISELTKPLVEILQLINANIQVVEDHMEALKDTRTKGDELHEETVTVMDDGIKRQLASHADDITLKQTHTAELRQRVEEYKQEREIIRDAAARFCVFLKHNSLARYNDVFIPYLDFLIKEEQAKVQAGGNDKRLLSLVEERHEHEEADEIIARHMVTDPAFNDLSEGGVDRMEQGLYNLKHFGENLRKLRHGITVVHEARYRERPYNVQRRKQPKKIS